MKIDLLSYIAWPSTPGIEIMKKKIVLLGASKLVFKINNIFSQLSKIFFCYKVV